MTFDLLCVSVCVGVLVTTACFAKTAEPIEILFRMLTHVILEITC